MKTLIIFCFTFFLILTVQAQVAINPCARATDIHVVVIGSSTAAGTGPLNTANAWVNRYRRYLQSINPNNLVTNLAVGGTTTYHIMPDWFIAPTGRPAVTPAKNVSQAISLGADAIIVNMPSNDAANGFGVNEQMFNFQMIASVADSAGIPVWVCTTQPKNFSTAQKAIQTAVRDSILSYFGSRAIDFWTGFADATNGLATFYDSGDGTHMNDTAHAELNQRVIAEAIPNLITDTLPYTDHVVNEIYLTNSDICGDYNTMVHVVVTNLGLNSSLSEDIRLRYFDISSNSGGSINTFQINQLGACQSDTVSATINSYSGTHQEYHAYLLNSSDINKVNDTSRTIELFTLGHPTIHVVNDTVPSGGNAALTASTSPGDTIVWYDASTGGNILAYGNQYMINNLTSPQIVFSEAVRGPLHFTNSLFTTAATTTNWNGIMFDIVAIDTIVIDSLQLKVHSTGVQQVVGYNRMGSLVGNEMNAAAWNAWGVDTVNAGVPGTFLTVDYPDITLYPNDTLGVYLHMQSSGATLSYQNSAAATFSDSKIQVSNGTGVAHTFGTTYSPRNWSGEVFYHYGFNPQGQCQSLRMPVLALVLWPTLNPDLEKLRINIVPNPSTGFLKFVGEQIPKKVQVSTLQGQVLRTIFVEANGIKLNNLVAGMYLLSFEIEGKHYVQKIMLRSL